jgi:cell wall-associated NlpC family hydrolase
MDFNIFFRIGCVACALIVQCAFAEEPPAQTPQAQSAVLRYRDGVQKIVDRALDLIGIRYRRGGDNPDTGFDCSGFVDHVFHEGLGLTLPRSSHELSETGTAVSKTELKPGDLVFFHTMRHAFSHVGIYLGDHLFVHAPRTGEAVGIADLRDRYWAKRYNGARRIDGE